MTDIKSFAALQDLRLKLARAPLVASKIAERAAARLTELAQEAFDSQSSVYGAPYRSGVSGPVDLVESGALRSKATKYEATGTKVRATVAAVRYAKYQLKRGFLPRRGSLPAEWDAELRRIATEELRKHFGG